MNDVAQVDAPTWKNLENITLSESQPPKTALYDSIYMKGIE